MGSRPLGCFFEDAPNSSFVVFHHLLLNHQHRRYFEGLAESSCFWSGVLEPSHKVPDDMAAREGRHLVAKDADGLQVRDEDALQLPQGPVVLSLYEESRVRQAIDVNTRKH